jgi:hypothetical protein
MNENIPNEWITWVNSNFIDNKKQEKKSFGQ